MDNPSRKLTRKISAKTTQLQGENAPGIAGTLSAKTRNVGFSTCLTLDPVRCLLALGQPLEIKFKTPFKKHLYTPLRMLLKTLKDLFALKIIPVRGLFPRLIKSGQNITRRMGRNLLLISVSMLIWNHFKTACSWSNWPLQLQPGRMCKVNTERKFPGKFKHETSSRSNSEPPKISRRCSVDNCQDLV